MAISSGSLAHRAGVSVETLRFYERRGLLPEPQRSLGGHREYTDDDVRLVRAIKSAQRLGFTLDEVARLLRDGAHLHNDESLQQSARVKLTEVEERIADLAVIAEALRATIAAECADLVNCAAPSLGRS